MGRLGIDSKVGKMIFVGFPCFCLLSNNFRYANASVSVIVEVARSENRSPSFWDRTTIQFLGGSLS